VSVDAKELIRLLAAQRQELGKFQRTEHSEGRWTLWVNKMDAILRNSFPAKSAEHQQFIAAIDWGGMITGPTPEARLETRNERFERTIKNTSAWLDALIFQIETFGIAGSSSAKSDPTSNVSKRYLLTSPVFIAERLWSRGQVAYRWVIGHKIHSFVIGAISLVGTIVGILAAVGAI
jgi:hypothetical protein